MPDTKKKRRDVERLVLSVFSALDRTGDNTKRYREFFGSLSDAQFSKWIKDFLAEEDSNFYLNAIPHKNEPSLEDIEAAAGILGVPLEERVVFPHLGGVKTRTPVPVGWLLIKRHQQIVSKKNSIASSIRQRNQRTGQVTGDSKAARESDMENYSLQTIGATHALRELMGPRADDMRAKEQMYGRISSEGFAASQDIQRDPAGKVALRTIDVLFIGAGIKTDLVNKSLLLQISADRPKAAGKKR